MVPGHRSAFLLSSDRQKPDLQYTTTDGLIRGATAGPRNQHVYRDVLAVPIEAGFLGLQFSCQLSSFRCSRSLLIFNEEKRISHPPRMARKGL